MTKYFSHKFLNSSQLKNIVIYKDLITNINIFWIFDFKHFNQIIKLFLFIILLLDNRQIHKVSKQ